MPTTSLPAYPDLKTQRHLWYYLVQLIKDPILQILNFNFPNLRCSKLFFFSFWCNLVIFAFLGAFGHWFKTYTWKKYSKSKQTKYFGFIKFGVWWAKREINLWIYTRMFLTEIKMDKTNANITVYFNKTLQPFKNHL